MVRGIHQRSPGEFHVDFARLVGSYKNIFRPRPHGPVTVQAVGRAVLAILDRSPDRGIDDGHLIAWNEYRIFLSKQDYDRLYELRELLYGELRQALIKRLRQLHAETVGDPIVCIETDRDRQLPPGKGVIRAQYKRNRDLQDAGDDGQITMRVRQEGPGRGPADSIRWGGSPTEHRTERVAEPGLAALRVRWPGGSAIIGAGQKVRLGRPHREAGETGFIGLVGAHDRINRKQLDIHNRGTSVTVIRLSDANPVAVDDRSIQPGGRLTISKEVLPVRISLSNGALILQLEPS